MIPAFGAHYSYGFELKWKYPIGEYNYSFNQSKLAAAGDLIFEMEMSRVSSSPAIGHDGTVSIADVIKLLLLQRDQDPRGDYNGDGELLINDAISLLKDIINGNCPNADVLSSASGCAGA